MIIKNSIIKNWPPYLDSFKKRENLYFILLKESFLNHDEKIIKGSKRKKKAISSLFIRSILDRIRSESYELHKFASRITDFGWPAEKYKRREIRRACARLCDGSFTLSLCFQGAIQWHRERREESVWFATHITWSR